MLRKEYRLECDCCGKSTYSATARDVLRLAKDKGWIVQDANVHYCSSECYEKGYARQDTADPIDVYTRAFQK